MEEEWINERARESNNKCTSQNNNNSNSNNNKIDHINCCIVNKNIIDFLKSLSLCLFSYCFIGWSRPPTPGRSRTP